MSLFPNKKKIYKTSILLSVLTGLLGGALAIMFIGKSYFNTWYLDRMSFVGEENGARVIIQSPENVQVTQDLRIEEVLKQVQPSMMSVYRKKTTGSDIVSQIYQEKDLVGYGMVLTSDGWLIAAGDFDSLKSSDILIVYDNQIKEVKTKVEDPSTGTVLLKIEAVDLPVVKFGTTENLSVGQQLLAVSKEGVTLTNLSSVNYLDKTELLYSSEKYYKYISLADTGVSTGSAVINFQGEFLGLVVDSSSEDFSLVMPMDLLKKGIGLVFRDGLVSFPYFGVHFIDISSSFGLNKQVTKGLETGALLYGRGQMRAIESDSPVNGLLKEGDIITKVNGQQVDPENSLSDLILDQRSGAEVELEYFRKAGSARTITVKLK